MDVDLARMLAGARTQWPQLHFAIQGGGYRRLLQALKEDELDIVLALVVDEPRSRHVNTGRNS